MNSEVKAARAVYKILRFINVLTSLHYKALSLHTMDLLLAFITVFRRVCETVKSDY